MYNKKKPVNKATKINLNFNSHSKHKNTNSQKNYPTQF